MSLTQNRWFRRLGFGAIAALSLCAATLMTGPAQADDYGYRGPTGVHHASYAPRFFYGFGGEHRWHQWDRWDHRDHRWR
jgi:hypothetical protein